MTPERQKQVEEAISEKATLIRRLVVAHNEAVEHSREADRLEILAEREVRKVRDELGVLMQELLGGGMR